MMKKLENLHMENNIPREGWEEMIKQEVEKNGPPERLISDFFDENNSDWTW